MLDAIEDVMQKFSLAFATYSCLHICIVLWFYKTDHLSWLGIYKKFAKAFVVVFAILFIANVFLIHNSKCMIIFLGLLCGSLWCVIHFPEDR